MISDFIIEILAFFLGVFVFPLTLLDNVTLPSEITNALTTVSPYYSAADAVLPVGTILFLIGVVEIPFLAALGIYIVARWVYQKIPGLN